MLGPPLAGTPDIHMPSFGHRFFYMSCLFYATADGKNSPLCPQKGWAASNICLTRPRSPRRYSMLIQYFWHPTWPRERTFCLLLSPATLARTALFTVSNTRPWSAELSAACHTCRKRQALRHLRDSLQSQWWRMTVTIAAPEAAHRNLLRCRTQMPIRGLNRLPFRAWQGLFTSKVCSLGSLTYSNWFYACHISAEHRRYSALSPV